MERISAACAMEWSIEFEKGLRSKKPGDAVKAIEQIGLRLQQWSREPKSIMAAYNIFGLVPGEDRLFANSILLRLADAFRLNDKATRFSVVRVFLSEFRKRDKEKKGRRYEGILSKARVHNHMELLKRVQIVFDTGDVESRALALVLFGCWADFANDSAHIRYIILSSLISSEMLEVKASLFAAGCFCELAADFASVVLEMLLNIVMSTDISMTIRLAGARVFAKMGCSYSIANRAHKIGLKLLIDSSEQDFLATMLVSLSKLASKSTLLFSEQVDLLLSFLVPERTLQLQATALRCLSFIFREGFCHSAVSALVIKTLLRVVDGNKLPLAMQCEALQILKKMLVYVLPELPCHNMLEYHHLLNIMEKVARSHIMSKSLLAIHALVDASTQLGKRTQIGSDEDCFFSLPIRIISIIMDQIVSLIEPLLNICQNNFKVFQEFRSLLSFLLFLVGEQPELGILVLDRVGSFIEHLVGMHDSFQDARQACVSVDELADFRGQPFMGITYNLVYIVYKFSLTCIENLNEVRTITIDIIDKVKFLVKCVQRCRLFDQYIYVIYSILLHSQIMWSFMLNKNEEPSSSDINLGNSLCNLLVEHEFISLENAEKMLTKRDYWPAYKSGTIAAYQGAWVTAAFIFGQLIGKVQSDVCSCWLKALAQYVQSEGKIQLLILPNLRTRLADWLQVKDLPLSLFPTILDEIGIGNINEPNYGEVLVGVYYGLCSSGETLKSIAMLGRLCCFQRWFLALRAKVLKTVVDVLKVLDTIPFIGGNNSHGGQVEMSVTVECLDSLQQITQLSFQLKSLAQELDLLAMSFIGMDSRSAKIISALALSCSLLAFTTGFALFISNLPDHEILTSGLESPRSCLQEILVHNLVGRLCLVDQETCSNLCLLLEVSGQPKVCFPLPHRSQMLNSSGEVRDILSVCTYVVSAIFGLQNKTKGMYNEEILSHVVKDGFQLVLQTFTKWIHIPFRIPKYFLKLRPCIGSELFGFSADARNSNELTVLLGFHLSVNLCLQLRNVPPNLRVQATKFYCILCSSASFQEPKSSGETQGQMLLDYKNCEIYSMMALNEKLLRYVTEIDKGKCCWDYNSEHNDGTVYRFICFELNDTGQGFANCLLDVSDFPLGSYRIMWHSCCVDNGGSYWSVLPLNAGPVFTVQKPTVVG